MQLKSYLFTAKKKSEFSEKVSYKKKNGTRLIFTSIKAKNVILLACNLSKGVLCRS